ncbi:hypothetical protein [Acinetobacter lwoffii]|uniref:hypothetical protein n=1 Tax=Acinetobacter lwoffii TaxID=28090 RepID=UPI003F911C81
MNLVNFDVYQNLCTGFILLLTFFISFIIGIRCKKDIFVGILIFLWHSLFALFYFLFTLNNPADAKAYYIRSIFDDTGFYVGTKFIIYLSSLFSRNFDLNYLNVSLIFNIFGVLGLIFLYFSLKKYFKSLSWCWYFLLFIPSMSFWSAGLGKDAISFFSVCLFLYTITTNKKIYILLPISFFFMFMVRPHIALMMIVSFILYFILKSKVHILFKLTTLPIIVSGIILASSFVQQYVGLEEASIDSVSSYVDQRQGYNQSGGSSIDLQSMSYPMQIFTYIFRPLPFDAHSALALFTSIENTILLFLFIYLLFKNKFRLYTFIEGKNTWLLIYAFLTCSMLAITTANLGIATRQKWMFMPIFLYLLVYAFYQYKQAQHVISIKK